MFEKGNQHSTGRPKGSPNKSTLEIKEAFQLLLNNNLPDIQSWIDQLEPKDKIKAILDLASYVIPKLKASDIKLDRPPDQALFLSPEQYDALIDVPEEKFYEVLGRDKCITK